MNEDVCAPVGGDDEPSGPPPGCPRGPWRSRFVARDKVREWAKSGAFFHGFFDVKLHGGLKRQKKTTITKLACRREGVSYSRGAVERRKRTKKCDCPWSLSLKARKLPDGETFKEPNTPAMPPPSPLSAPTENDGGDGASGEEPRDANGGPGGADDEGVDDVDEVEEDDDLGDGTWEWYIDDDLSHTRHNHDLTPMEYAIHDAGMRHFPPWALDRMKVLKSLLPAADIIRALEECALEYCAPVTWTHRDVYNHLQLPEEVKAMDAALLLEWCEKQKDESAFFDYRKDIDTTTGRLKSVVWISHDGYQLYQTFNDVLLLDVTHGTNKLGMRLALFVTFDGEGLTRVLGGALLPNETSESFDFMLSSFMELVGGVQPKVCFTDEDAWLRDAIKRLMPKTVLLLCVMHLWQNVIKHMKGRFRYNVDWTNFVNLWWKIIYRDDEADVNTFDAEWAHLVGHLPVDVRGGMSLEIFEKYYGGPSFLFDELEDEDEGWTLVDLKPETREFDDYVLVEKPRAMSYEWSAEVGLRVSGQPPLLRTVEGAHRPITQEEKKARQVVEDKNERRHAEHQRAMDSGAQMTVLTEEDEVKYCSAAAAYIDKLYNIRELYCRRWTHEHPGCGAHSTQRAESIHNAVKGLLNTRVPISELPERVERTCNHAKHKHSAIQFIQNWTLELKPMTQAEFLQSVKNELTKYAFTYLSKEYLQAVNYTVKDVEGKPDLLIVCRNDGAKERTLDGDHESVRTVRLQPNTYLRSDRRVYLVEGFPMFCSCQVMSFMGLFCRHMFQIIIVKQQQDQFKEMALDMVSTRWLQKNNGDGANMEAAMSALKVKCSYKPTFVDNTMDPLDAVPVERRYGYVMQLAKQVASRASQSKSSFKSVVHTFEGVLRGMSGFSGGDAPAASDAPPAKKAKHTAGAGPSVLNPMTSRGPGRPKTVKEGMIGCAPAGAGPGRPSATTKTTRGGGATVGGAEPAREKVSQMGSRKGQRRFKSVVEMSRIQKGSRGKGAGKGKGSAAE